MSESVPKGGDHECLLDESDLGGNVSEASQISRLEQQRQASEFAEANTMPLGAGGSNKFTSAQLNNGAKQRILGAAVLASLGVLFLPVLLQRPDAPSVDTRTQIPSLPESLSSNSSPVTVVPAPPPKNIPDDVFEVETIDEISPAVTSPATVVVNRPSSAKASVGESYSSSNRPISSNVDASKTPAVPKGWVIQVASYANDAGAQNLVTRLLQKQFRAYSKAVSAGGKPRYRVFVGPYLQKKDAQLIQSDIDLQLSVQSLLLRHR